MSLLPFGKLAAAKARSFVPQNIDLGDWPQIAPLFDQLEARGGPGRTAAELERWLLDWSELNAALDEEASRRYIAMTCHTDHAEAEKAYLHFVENVEPATQAPPVCAWKNSMSPTRARARLLKAAKGRLSRYAVFDRDVQKPRRPCSARKTSPWKPRRPSCASSTKN